MCVTARTRVQSHRCSQETRKYITYRKCTKNKEKARKKLHKIPKHAIIPSKAIGYRVSLSPISYLLPPLLMLTQLEVKKSSTNTGVKIFSFHGELDETNVDTTFPNIIADIGSFQGSRTLFNLVDLKYLNSKSIGYIADIAQRTEDGGGKFALSNIGPEVRDTLDLVGITSIIPVYDAEDVALNELSK